MTDLDELANASSRPAPHRPAIRRYRTPGRHAPGCLFGLAALAGLIGVAFILAAIVMDSSAAPEIAVMRIIIAMIGVGAAVVAAVLVGVGAMTAR